MHTLKRFMLIAGLVPVMALAMATPAFAQAERNNPDSFWTGGDPNADFRDDIALGDRDPRTIAAQIINVLLGFLGIIAVVIILAGGFKWMTAGGNQDKVDEAKKLMSAGVIGLVIVLASYGIATFIINSLVTATT